MTHFTTILSDSTNDVRTFQRIFGDQQVEALKLRNPAKFGGILWLLYGVWALS